MRIGPEVAHEAQEGIRLLGQPGHRTLQRVSGHGNRDNAVAAHRAGGLGKHGAGPCIVLAAQDVTALIAGNLTEE